MKAENEHTGSEKEVITPPARELAVLRQINEALVLLLENQADGHRGLVHALQRIGEVMDADGLLYGPLDDSGPAGLPLRRRYALLRESGYWRASSSPLAGSLPLSEKLKQLPPGEALFATPRDFTPQTPAFLRQHAMGSAWLFPLWIDDRCWGFLGLTSQDENRTWRREEAGLLTPFLLSLSNFLARKAAEKSLIEQQDRNFMTEHRLRTSILATIPEWIVVVDYSNLAFKYLNIDPDGQILGYQLSQIRDPYQYFKSRIHPDHREAHQLMIAQIAELPDGRFMERELCLLDAEDNWRWIWVRNRVFSRDEQGRVSEFIALVQDITEQKKSQLALQQQRDYLHRIIDSSPNLIFAKDRAGRYTMANKALIRIYRTTFEDLLGKNDNDFNPNLEETAFLQRANEEVIATGKTKFIRSRTIHDPDGNPYVVQILKTPLCDEQGAPQEVLTTVTDITHQKKVEEQIRAEQRLNQDILATIPEAILVVDYQTLAFSYLNRRLKEPFFGHPVAAPNDPVAFFKTHIHPDDLRPPAYSFITAIGRAGDDAVTRLEFRLQSPDGSWRWLSARAKVFKRHPSGEVKEFLALLQDVTPRKLARQQLITSERRYRNFIRYSTEGIYYVNCGRPIPIDLPPAEQVRQYYDHAYVEECNIAFASMYGFDRTEAVVGMKVYDAHAGDHFEENARSFIAMAENGYKIESAETLEKDQTGRPQGQTHKTAK